MRIAGAQVAQMSQEVRDAVGTLLLQLTLKELFQWRFMQTDPNWGNFLFDGNSGILHLIDFGKLVAPCSVPKNLPGAVGACLQSQRLEHPVRYNLD